MPTTYTILSHLADSETWVVSDTTVDAPSSRLAIAGYVKANNLESGEYVAIPTRSWKPVTVAVETRSKVTFT